MMAYESKIFSIDPEVEKRIHPEALRVLTNWEKFELLMLQAEITAADIHGYLKDNEKVELQRCVSQIWEGLKTCMDIRDKVTPYDVYIGDIFLKNGIISDFQRTSRFPLFSIKSLLEKACGRRLENERREAEEAREKKRREEEQERQEAAKAEEERKRQIEKAEQERKKNEEEERWRTALEAVNPPTDDARRYLDRPGEYDEFIQAVLKAVRACIEKGEDYLNDSRAFDYHWCLTKIHDRKEKERRHIAAKLEARQYNQRLNKGKTRLKALLCPNQKDLKSYFEKEIKDRRYIGENFKQFLSSEEEQAFDKTIVDIATRRLGKLVSNDRRRFIDREYYRCFFLLPSAEYSFVGVPCIDFIFDVFVVVETRVWLKPGQKTFGGYAFNLPWREEKGYSVLLQEPEFLGYDYIVLTPEDLGGYVPWENIPLVLIKGLMNGELQPAGTTVLAASEARTTYKIKGFEGEATIPDSFANYLKEIGGIDQMVSIGIIGKKVANVIEKTFTQPETKEKTPLLPDKQGTGYEDKDLLSSLTELGIPFKETESLLPLIPKNLALPEAIKFALQKHMKS